MTQRYIHITNWDQHQHPDVTRNKEAAARWIKEKTSQLTDEDYLELGLADRGLLHGLRFQYAANRGRGVVDSTANLTRLLGVRVYRSQLERLNQACFIEFSASRTLASCKSRLEENRLEEKNLATASREELSTGSLLVPDQATNGAADEDIVLPCSICRGLAKGGDCPRCSPPANGRHLALVDVALRDHYDRPLRAQYDAIPRPRDDIWDLLEIKFGPVGAKGSNAHAKRNKACADLKRAGATVELVRAACDRWPAVFASATLTDAALATHYPLLAQPLLAKASRPAPCQECEIGGGHHAVGCSRAVA